MAASSFLLLIAAVALLISPALSLTCNSKILSPQNTTFSNCTVLPTLNAVLHWNYSSTASPKPTLSIAFTATPASSDGWVAWALNPNGTGMVGSQALIAFKESGALVVKTYNISSYTGINESKISYAVLNSSAEYYSGGNITLYATLALPAALTAASPELNQVWQVGSGVVAGVPSKHAFDTANLDSKGKLNLVSGSAETPSQSPSQSPEAATSPGPSAGKQNGNATGSGARVLGGGLGVYGISVLLWVSYFGF